MSQVRVPFYLHDLGEAEVSRFRETLAGPILTTGATVAEFESRFAAYLGRKHAVALSSCTGAMHLALLARGIGPGDEVITTPMTFIATATAICESGAKPVFSEVESSTGNLDVSKLETKITPRTRAIIPVHLYGQMCDMRALRKLADRHGLVLIEDSAHCVEGERDGVRPGELSDAACFSFFATKAITCGEGGALVTDDRDLAAQVRLLSVHGMDKTSYDRFRDGYRHWDMPVMGWKYNLDNLRAALLLPQLDRIEDNRDARHQLVNRYKSLIDGISGVSFAQTLPDAKHACHLFTVWVAPDKRDSIIQGLHSRGIPVVVNYRAIHLLSYFKDTLKHQRGDFPIAERIGDSTISLPLYSKMPKEHVDIVCDALDAVTKSHDLA